MRPDATRGATRRSRALIPEYGPGWRSKVLLPSVISSDQYRIFTVVAQAPDGTQRRARVTPSTYLELVAATSFKQRTRKMMEYYHADRLNYAVDRHAESARVRSGLLREERRRRRRPETDRASVQEPGLPARRVPRGTGDDPLATADDGHVLAAADAGGVLLLPAVRQDGPVPLRAEQRHRGRRRRRRR